ncbi:MAG: DUF6236 family protein [Pyrinomonadaceae bacterium]
MVEEKTRLKETILYYPTISIPTVNWLRQVLLYWDEIGSIVPQNYEDRALIPFTPEIQYLKDEGEFRSFRTDSVALGDWNKVQEFEAEIIDAVKSDSFQQNLLPREMRSISSRIHKDKVSRKVYGFLEDAGLAINHRNLGDWYYFESQTALLYMSILAKFIADLDRNITIPGTNVQKYAELNYSFSSGKEKFPVLAADFFKILPIPAEGVSLQDILHFKRNRSDELNSFRIKLREFQQKLMKCSHISEVKDTLVDSRSILKKGLKDLEDTFNDAKLLTRLGSIQTLLKSSSPGWLASLMVETDFVKKIADIPVKWTLGGALVLGGIGIAVHSVNARNQRRAELRKSPFSYLYHAKQYSINY